MPALPTVVIALCFVPLPVLASSRFPNSLLGEDGFCFCSFLSSNVSGKVFCPFPSGRQPLLVTRPMVGTGEVSCPSLLCSFSYCPPPSSRHLLFPPEIVNPCINPAGWNFLPVPQQLKTLLI